MHPEPFVFFVFRDEIFPLLVSSFPPLLSLFVSKQRSYSDQAAIQPYSQRVKEIHD
jgi:hypothetical protein